MADLRQVLRILRFHGVSVRVVDGQLVARFPEYSPFPDDMRAFTRHFRDRLVAYLLEEERLAETVTNILALTPEEQEQYRRELTAAPFDQEHIQHDREAWRRARIQMDVIKEIAA